MMNLSYRDTVYFIQNAIKIGARKRAKKEYESKKQEYRQSYFIEQVIGKIKNAYGGLERTKSYEMARKHIWAKMVLYNWVMIFLSYWIMRVRFYHQYPTSDSWNTYCGIYTHRWF